MFCNLVRTGFVTCQNQLTRFPPRLANRFSSSNFNNKDNIIAAPIAKENVDESDTFGTIDKQYNEKIASNFVFEEVGYLLKKSFTTSISSEAYK